ncbi:MAG: NAD-dependent epimerase/dehydratase family protein [Candidatus Aminicenantes bacterium]|nr:NAD-dependent epimerase/dehydratase family protein [Candidatus Aminicenantes bacterium]
MKALVTGSSGFIGSHLTEGLIQRGYEVTCLIRKNSDLKWTHGLDVSFVTADYLNKHSLRNSVAEMDYVFHLAAVLHAVDWTDYHKANVLATKYLIQACVERNPGLKKFVFVSSISASGPVLDPSIRDETCTCRPSSFYGKSKLLAEKEVLGFKDQIPITIARPPNVIGTRQKEVYLLLKLLKRHLFPVLGKKDHQTSICFVKDLAQALILMAEKKQACSQTYYITDHQIHCWRELLKIAAQKMGVYPYVIKIPYPVLLSIAKSSEIIAKITGNDPLITTRYLCSTRNHYHLYSSQKIQQELGFKHQTEYSQGIQDIINWYKKHHLL